MRAVFQIAQNTYREWMRDRVFWVSSAFGGFFLFVSILGGSVDPFRADRVVASWGYVSIRICLLGLALLLGVGMVHREIERRTIQLMLSRRVSWSRFVFSKYIGLLALILVNGGIMVLGWALSQKLLSPEGSLLGVLQVSVLVLAEAALLGAVAVFWSSISRPPLAASLSAMSWIFGHQQSLLKQIHQQLQVGDGSVSDVLLSLLLSLGQVFPRFELFVREFEVNHFLILGWKNWGGTLIYGFVFSVSLVGLGGWMFQRRSSLQ